MINLIPPAAQAQIKREYWARVAAVWLFMIGTAILIVVTLHVPAYVLVSSQLTIFTDGYEAAAEDNIVFKESEAAVKKANAVAKLLDVDDESVPFSEFHNELHTLSGDQVVLSTVTMSRSAGVVQTISVSGRADTRGALAQFRDVVEDSDYFISANLPLSNLAKDRNLVFTISIEPAELNIPTS